MHPTSALASGKIQEGTYWSGLSTPMIEVYGDRFSVDGAMDETRSQPISGLEPIDDGIFFYNDQYWCRSDIPPSEARLEGYENVICTEKGWVSIKTPDPAAKPPAYCAQTAYRDFFVHFVRGYDDRTIETRNHYTWPTVEIRHAQPPHTLLATLHKEDYRAFRLASDRNWISVDNRNQAFDLPERKTPPADRVRLDLSTLQGTSFKTRLRAQRYAMLEFHEVSKNRFRVDYREVTYASSQTNQWIEAAGASGAYVFEHRKGCWHLTQDLRNSPR
ncbi:hypothetical protein [Alkalinema pantanalense]|uniref:hypothetical protein n=1 Tax=Alkalinema pantanalense TaxID=1620705 RepID=UPI003D6ED54F